MHLLPCHTSRTQRKYLPALLLGLLLVGIFLFIPHTGHAEVEDFSIELTDTQILELYRFSLPFSKKQDTSIDTTTSTMSTYDNSSDNSEAIRGLLVQIIGLLLGRSTDSKISKLSRPLYPPPTIALLDIQAFCPNIFVENLAPGDIGHGVTQIQELLFAHSYLDEKTGLYDEVTLVAVTSLQENHGLATTGLWDAATQEQARDIICTIGKVSQGDPLIITQQSPSGNLARTSVASPCKPFTHNFYEGAIDPEVKRLQVFLNRELNTILPETNYYSPEMSQVVRLLQSRYAQTVLYSNGYSQTTGQFGPATRAMANFLCLE
jgi:peptidoglycan hydrolase-like protein with peptidoglycan-binding domain